MKFNRVLAVLSGAAMGFFIGVSFPVQIITPKVSPFSFGDGNCIFGSNILGRFSTPFRNNSINVNGTQLLQSNATSKNVVSLAKPKGADMLPPNIVVRESDLHLRRLWGDPREDTPTGKYLLAMTVGYSEKVNVNATVHKFSENFDILLFHYDGRTTEWDEFEWSKKAIHVSARKQAKWWYAKRFLHPSIVAPYEYIFVWDQDLGTETFDAEEYIKIVKKHGLEISQPGMDITRGVKTYDINVRVSDSEMHKSTPDGGCGTNARRRPCSGFVEVNSPVFSREAWTCAWHMVQSDLVHGWGLDWNFWRCVDDPEEQMGVVDAQYVAHHDGYTLGDGDGDGSRGSVRNRAWVEFGMFNARMQDADKAQEAARLGQSDAATRT
ncbi:unnamed protein product [Urochloa decumbens]|uniref:Uncharacterized protein n=1 Tax=Urochloa decumbens TaxID=240449 RepID=A0ABC9C3F2_9POAL